MTSTDPTLVVTPTNIGAVPKLLSEVVAAGDALAKAGDSSSLPRLELLAKARELTRALETPREIMIQQLWTQPLNATAISFGVQSGLWSAMAKNGDGPQSVADLAKQLGIEEELLQRMMRHIAASGYLDMTAPDVFTPNLFSKSLALSKMAGGYHTCQSLLYPVLADSHDWFKSRGYKIPSDKQDTMLKTAHNTSLHMYEYLQTIPPHGKNFNDLMDGYHLGRPAWADEGFYPVRERLIEGFDTASKDAVLLVDVAGGIGHYTDQFRSRFPDAPGRLVLQDLPVVIEQIQKLHPRIERMGHDFFEEQPVKGARAYYMHFILHNWVDEDCVKIVSRVKEAMKPGYSRFLVHDHVVPRTEQDPEQTALDLIMLAVFNSKERSAAQWSELLEKRCGLRIVNTWTIAKGIESVVECELPQ